MGFGGGHDKNGVRRRLLQGFQEGIKGVLGEHVDFIDNKNLITTLGREIFNIFPKFPNLIDAPVTGPVDFQDIETMPLGDLQTRLALVAGRRRRTVDTVQGLGQNAGHGGLTHAPGAAKEKGVRHPSQFQGIFQGTGDVFLPHNFIEILGSPFSG